MELKVKIYGIWPVSKKQFYFIYGIASSTFLFLAVFFTIFELPVSSDSSNFERFSSEYFHLFWTFLLLLTIIEGQFYWNRFTKAHLKLIAEQKEEIETQAEDLLVKNEEIQLQNCIIEEKNRNITDSINYAQRIQKAVFQLSEDDKTVEQDLVILLKPKDIVSGDFYWIKKIGTKSVFVGADCTGHGVPGAFMSLLGISYLNQVVHDNLKRKNEVIQKDHSKIGIYYEYIETENELRAEPEILLDELRVLIKLALHQAGYEADAKDGIDMALCIFDSETYMLQYAGAHRPLIYVSNGELNEVKADRFPVGVHLKEKPFTGHRIQLHKGDCFYMFSDGIVDQFGSDNDEKFKMKKLLEILDKVKTLPIKEQVKIVEDEFNDWKGIREQIDDVLFMAVGV